VGLQQAFTKTGAATGDITRLLIRVRDADQRALEDLIKIAYPELRRLARRYIGKERPDHTLQATELIHEAYIRLVGRKPMDYRDHTHFFAAAARIMRNLLVDHARARHGAKRRCAGAVQLDEALTLAACDSGEILVLEDALKSLARFDELQSRIVEMRYFAGLTNQEIGSLLNLSERTVKREWRMAKAWLYNEVRG
jgi:RNA polymerase sigma factor (TIGR02999 family)